jgi:transcriptional regulator with XRE-family HTH domain
VAGYTPFGLRARKAMLLKGIKLSKLANELDVSTTYVSQIFKGLRTGSKQKPLIAQYLGIKE